jgi:hypothetical protein
MAGFWEHYARVNDDIRTELIDKGWYEGRMESSTAMQNNVQSMANQQQEPTREDLYPTVQSQDTGIPEAIRGSGIHAGTDQNPEATKAAVEEFYGVRETPSGTEIGQENMRTEWTPEARQVESHELYGESQAADEPAIHEARQSESAEEQGQIERDQLYGYDALEEEQDQQQGMGQSL